MVLLAIVYYSQFLDLLYWACCMESRDEEDGSRMEQEGAAYSNHRRSWLKDDVMRISDELVKMLVHTYSHYCTYATSTYNTVMPKGSFVIHHSKSHTVPCTCVQCTYCNCSSSPSSSTKVYYSDCKYNFWYKQCGGVTVVKLYQVLLVWYTKHAS